MRGRTEYADLDETTEPERVTESIIERPDQARLLLAVLLAPVLVELRHRRLVRRRVAHGLESPFRALPEARVDLARRELAVPFSSLLHAAVPCVIQPVRQILCRSLLI